MASFTNFATLSYNGGTTNSNTVTGEILETLAATKTAVRSSYGAGEDVAYVINLVNSGSTPLGGLTLADDLGGYTVGGNTVYPLAYKAGSVKYFINGVLQTAPTATAGPPLTIEGISVPAGGNATVVYEADITAYAPLAAENTITNTVTVTGAAIAAPVTATETIGAESRANLSISKALSPAAVAERGRITYTFVIENTGNAAAEIADDVVFTDNFDPVLSDLIVAYNGTAWTQGTNYTYDETTGAFASLPGQITVPAASYTQNEDGTFTVTPGTATLIISGTV